MRRSDMRNDRGAASVFVILAAAGIVVLGVLLVNNLGGASQTRRVATTAADAAALAAAQEWRDEVGRRYAEDTSSDSTVGDFAGRRLVDLRGSAESRAGVLAHANGAVLEEVRFDPSRAEVTVTTRVDANYVESSHEFRATATASLKFRSGACRDGGTLGLMLATCATSPSELPADGLTTSDVAHFRVDVALVR